MKIRNLIIGWLGGIGAEEARLLRENLGAANERARVALVDVVGASRLETDLRIARGHIEMIAAEKNRLANHCGELERKLAPPASDEAVLDAAIAAVIARREACSP